MTLEDSVKEIVQGEGSDIQVDWKKFTELAAAGEMLGSQTHSAELFSHILEYLEQQGVLVNPNTPGSFFVTDEVGNAIDVLSPRTGIAFHFSKEDYARGYAQGLQQENLYLNKRVKKIS
jgi:hypothetical protein